ncbi:MAG: polyprenol monophosphomannose synthase [Actinobacteria bacterium]|nr:polyprenol monophosphomannose synthase [Actinomycetota bacterium]
MPHAVAGPSGPSLSPARLRSHSTWIVVPTYNEAGNLPELVRRLRAGLRGEAARLLIVDDGSPDGTGLLAERLARADGDMQVLHRTSKDGIGAAYVAGFRAALAAGATRVVQMDADMSHAPEDVSRLLAAAETADLAIGSRYVAGGATPDWSLSRRLISRGGSIYARTLLGVGVRDLTGGFKCWSRRALEAVALEQVRGRGYVFQIELTYRALRAGMRVEEIPIEFRDRTRGQSKMCGAIVLEAIAAVPRLRRELTAPRLARPAADLSLASIGGDG